MKIILGTFLVYMILDKKHIMVLNKMMVIDGLLQGDPDGILKYDRAGSPLKDADVLQRTSYFLLH